MREDDVVYRHDIAARHERAVDIVDKSSMPATARAAEGPVLNERVFARSSHVC